MNCDEVKLELALWVGSDLDDPTRIEELRRHVATCPQCRTQAKSLQASMSVLGAIDPNPTFDHSQSLWPELNARIDYLEKAPRNPPAYGKWAILLACGAGLGLGIWSLANRPAPPSEPPQTVSHPVPVTPTTPSQSSNSSSAL
jgi:hypothetical protein